MAPMRSRSIRLRDPSQSARPQGFRRHVAVGAMAAAGLLAAASNAQAQAEATPLASAGPASNDPLEGFNRASFKLGMSLDGALLAPITHGYMAVTPRVVRDRVSAAIYNLGEPNTVMNQVLQGKPRQAVRSSARFVVNSTVGVAGLFDVAAKMGLPPRGADFGQTFGRWGAGPGAYIYVPLMGPLNVRDGVGRALDIVTDPVSLFVGGLETDFGKARIATTVVDLRARTDSAYHALDDAADPYVTTRSAYAQYREALVREATGETEALPDFDAPPPEPTPSPPAANP
ncbi:VacJ family lipoprotein [Caulobacter vibrioides]|uniref:VacJ family lipoprotein n=1 Tax=Caulobacter vibrioides TaxID=155892 RepID=A0A290N251_CAUVI|nr:MlaA family lipoprotein [Caulobacter vibrioides]ATC33673.1 VacJ family lipoprotein [Caulobacter vibrioides]